MKLSITAFALFALQGAAFAQSNSKCADMAKFKSPGVTLEISRAANIAEGRVIGARGGAAGPVLPAHCRIDGMMNRRTDVHGKTYGIRFAIALPAPPPSAVFVSAACAIQRQWRFRKCCKLHMPSMKVRQR